MESSVNGKGAGTLSQESTKKIKATFAQFERNGFLQGNQLKQFLLAVGDVSDASGAVFPLGGFAKSEVVAAMTAQLSLRDITGLISNHIAADRGTAATAPAAGGATRGAASLNASLNQASKEGSGDPARNVNRSAADSRFTNSDFMKHGTESSAPRILGTATLRRAPSSGIRFLQTTEYIRYIARRTFTALTCRAPTTSKGKASKAKMDAEVVRWAGLASVDPKLSLLLIVVITTSMMSLAIIGALASVNVDEARGKWDAMHRNSLFAYREAWNGVEHGTRQWYVQHIRRLSEKLVEPISVGTIRSAQAATAAHRYVVEALVREMQSIERSEVDAATTTLVQTQEALASIEISLSEVETVSWVRRLVASDGFRNVVGDVRAMIIDIGFPETAPPLWTTTHYSNASAIEENRLSTAQPQNRMKWWAAVRNNSFPLGVATVTTDYDMWGDLSIVVAVRVGSRLATCFVKPLASFGRSVLDGMLVAAQTFSQRNSDYLVEAAINVPRRVAITSALNPTQQAAVGRTTSLFDANPRLTASLARAVTDAAAKAGAPVVGSGGGSSTAGGGEPVTVFSPQDIEPYGTLTGAAAATVLPLSRVSLGFLVARANRDSWHRALAGIPYNFRDAPEGTAVAVAVRRETQTEYITGSRSEFMTQTRDAVVLGLSGQSGASLTRDENLEEGVGAFVAIPAFNASLLLSFSIASNRRLAQGVRERMMTEAATHAPVGRDFGVVRPKPSQQQQQQQQQSTRNAGSAISFAVPTRSIRNGGAPIDAGLSLCFRRTPHPAELVLTDERSPVSTLCAKTGDDDQNVLVALLTRDSLSLDIWRRVGYFTATAVALAIISLIVMRLLVHNVLDHIEKDYTAYKSQIEDEKRQFSELVKDVMPAYVGHRLGMGERLIVDRFPQLTFFFSDIVGFTDYCRSISTPEMVRTVGYTFMVQDKVAEYYGIFKVKTIGDAYFGVAGLEDSDSNKDAESREALQASETERRESNSQIVRMLSFASIVKLLLSDTFVHRPEAHECFLPFAGDSPAARPPLKPLQMRMGIHSGPAVAGVVDVGRAPHFDAFGPAVSLACRMEATAPNNRIQISAQTYEMLMKMDIAHLFEFEPPKKTLVKGHGTLTTYVLLATYLQIPLCFLAELKIDRAVKRLYFGDGGLMADETGSRLSGSSMASRSDTSSMRSFGRSGNHEPRPTTPTAGADGPEDADKASGSSDSLSDNGKPTATTNLFATQPQAQPRLVAPPALPIWGGRQTAPPSTTNF